MVTPQQIFDEYVQLRNNGSDATTVLQTLRGKIELLPANERATMVKQVKVWETQLHAVPQAGAQPSPLKPITPPSKPGKPTAEAAKVTCPNCGKMNSDKDVFCFSCGYVLQNQSSPFSTTVLNSSEGAVADESYFGAEATLVLHLRGTNKMYRLQPQKQQHEMIVGRGDGGTMAPDVDLADQGAGQLGVSRLHLGIRYSGKHNTVSISDMNSANGTFVNGQRLHPQEVRVLRHGDEVRMGRMVFQVLFHQWM